MPIAAWRLNLQPASFNGIPFKVEVQAKASGRRIVPHEFPKKNIPYAEDMGRRIRRFVLTAYIIFSPSQDPDYEANRDALIDALESEGPGLLVLPTGLHVMGDEPSGMVVVDTYQVTERREQGGYCEFEIVFLEAGQAIQTAPVQDTVGAVNDSAQSAISNFQKSNDITELTVAT